VVAEMVNRVERDARVARSKRAQALRDAVQAEAYHGFNLMCVLGEAHESELAVVEAVFARAKATRERFGEV
jgi:hypothetical protein